MVWYGDPKTYPVAERRIATTTPLYRDGWIFRLYQLGCSAYRNIVATTGPLTRLATPFYAISLAKELCSISTFIFIGHSAGGAHALGAVTLGCMIANVTGYSLCYGFNTSLDTIMSQSFGARSFKAAALYSEAAVIVMTLACLPIITLWWHSSYVLYYVMNIPLAVALKAQAWTRIASFGLWPCLIADVLRRWLQGQQCVWPVITAQSIALCVNIGMNHFFVDVMQWGLEGAAWVAVIQKWSDFVALLLLVAIRERQLDVDQHKLELLLAQGSGFGADYSGDVDDAIEWGPDKEGHTKRLPASPRRMIPPFAPFLQRVSSINLVALRDVSTIESTFPQYVWMDNNSSSNKYNNQNNNNHNNSNNNNHNINNNNNVSTQMVESYDDDVSDTLSSDEDNQGLGKDRGQGLGKGHLTTAIPSIPIRARGLSRGNHSDGRIRPSPIDISDSGQGQGIGLDTAQVQRLARRATTRDVGRCQDGLFTPLTDSRECDNRDHRLGWVQFERLAHLGLPGSCSQFVELGCFELMACIAAQLGPVPLAAHGVFVATANLFYIAPQALALASATMAGSSLGASRPRDAKRFVKVGIFLGTMHGLFSAGLILTALRSVWGGIFTSDIQVQNLVYTALPVMSAYLLANSVSATTLTLLRSTGRPLVTVWGNSGACLLIMLPGGWLLAQEHGLAGLWGAMSLCWASLAVVYLVVILQTNWKAQAIVVVVPSRRPLSSPVAEPRATSISMEDQKNGQSQGQGQGQREGQEEKLIESMRSQLPSGLPKLQQKLGLRQGIAQGQGLGSIVNDMTIGRQRRSDSGASACSLVSVTSTDSIGQPFVVDMDNAHGQGLGAGLDSYYRGGIHIDGSMQATRRGLLGTMYSTRDGRDQNNPREGSITSPSTSNQPVYEAFPTLTRGRSRSGSGGSESESGMGLLSSLRRQFRWSISSRSRSSGDEIEEDENNLGPNPGIAAMSRRRTDPYPPPYVYPHPYTYSQSPSSQSLQRGRVTSLTMPSYTSSSHVHAEEKEEDIVTPPNTTYTTLGRPPLGRSLSRLGVTGEGTRLLAQGQGPLPRYGLSLSPSPSPDPSPSPGPEPSPIPDADRMANFFRRVWRRFSTPFRSTPTPTPTNMLPSRPIASTTTTPSTSYYYPPRRENVAQHDLDRSGSFVNGSKRNENNTKTATRGREKQYDDEETKHFDDMTNDSRDGMYDNNKLSPLHYHDTSSPTNHHHLI